MTSLLSMGAVFAIFAAYYNWSPYITGYMYNEYYSKIQYWVLLIGVNTLFFPMHFLGLAGMARRIPDYPDAYSYWNYIASIGSMITLISILLFFYILYDQYTNKLILPYPSMLYYVGNKKLKTMNNSIELILPSPSKYHTYNQVPCI